jgi:hypothetical protein
MARLTFTKPLPLANGFESMISTVRSTATMRSANFKVLARPTTVLTAVVTGSPYLLVTCESGSAARYV